MVLDFAILAAVVALWRWEGGKPCATGANSR